jgi:hypothetical protein
VGDVVEPPESLEPPPLNPLEAAWPPTTKSDLTFVDTGASVEPDGALARLDGVLVTLLEPNIELFWRFPSTRGEPFET